MFGARVFRVMIGAPSDIKQEIEYAFEAMYKWNRAYAENSHLILMPCNWEKNTYPAANGHPQKSINHQLTDKSDMLICIFGGRLGSPTDTHSSGSIEEIEEHRKNGRHVMVFFRNQINRPNPDEYKRLCDYKEAHKDELYWCQYEDEKDFKDVFDYKLQLFLADTWLNPNYIEPQSEANVELELSSKEISLNYGTQSTIQVKGIDANKCIIDTTDSDIAYATEVNGEIEIRARRAGETLLKVSYGNKLAEGKIIVLPITNFCGSPILDFNISIGELAEKAKGNISSINDDVIVVSEGKAQHVYSFKNGLLETIISIIPTDNTSYLDCSQDAQSSMNERYRPLTYNSLGQWYQCNQNLYVVSFNAYNNGVWFFVYGKSQDVIANRIKAWKDNANVETE